MGELIKTKRYKSAKEFLRDISYEGEMYQNLKDGFVFRGHQLGSYKLIPSVLRHKLVQRDAAGNIVEDEKDAPFNLAGSEFIQKNVEYLELRNFFNICDKSGLRLPQVNRIRHTLFNNHDIISFFLNGDDWLPNDLQELAALAQHYGMETRLLDWTTNIDIAICEIGGTVGDIEGLSIIEAIRQVGLEKNPEDVLYVHVTLLPYISGSNEIKSKPTQHSVKELQSLGIKPDILVCRSEMEIPDNIREKIALFCNVRKTSVIQNLTADCLYAVPLMLEKEGLGREVCNHLKLDNYVPNNEEWEKMIKKIRNIKKEDRVKIAIVGKYVRLEDSYISVIESLNHAGFANNVNVDVELIDSETITQDTAEKILKGLDGIIVPGGFGNRGIEGKIETIKYARENNIPFLGICLGMQMAVVEFARNVLGIKDANSAEFSDTTKNPVIHIMENQKNIEKKGGTMRLGSYPCILKPGTVASRVYKTEKIDERHRHRYEYNNDYKERLENAGLICSGTSPDGSTRTFTFEIVITDCLIICKTSAFISSSFTSPLA